MKIKIIFLLVAIVTLISTFFIYLNKPLTEKQAFLKLFGNYDPIKKISIWKNMNFPKDKEDSYFEEKTGITNKVLYQSYKGNGNKKILLITKTVPINFPFGCWSTQCTAYSSEIHFDNSKKVDFYPFKIKKFGTRNDETQEDRAVPVNEESVYEFRNGKYMQVSGEKWPQVDCKALEAS